MKDLEKRIPIQGPGIDSEIEDTEDHRTARSSKMDSLLKNLERSGDTGAGVDLLRRKARERGRNLEREERERDPGERSRSKPKITKSDDPEYKGFIAERVAVPTGTNANVRKQIAGKNLKYKKYYLDYPRFL